MIQAEIATPWVFDGAEDSANRPLIGDEYELYKWEDVTGQPVANFPLENNTYVVKAQMAESIFNEIESDKTYFVLWSESMPDPVIPEET